MPPWVCAAWRRGILRTFLRGGDRGGAARSEEETMKRTAIAAAALVLAATGLTGCVTASKYRELEAERDILHTEQDRLTQDVAKLQEQLAQLQSETDALTAKRDSLRAEGDSLRQERDALEDERDALKKSKDETVSRYDAVVSQLSQEVKKGSLQIKRYKNMLTVDVADKIFFASGSAEIKESGKAVLKKVGKALAQYNDKVIRVVGHTDNVPLTPASRKQFPTNWELSVARATTVVRFHQDECKINPERLVAAGRGPYQPVASNDSPESRQKNRRIEIMLLDRNLADGANMTSTNP
jgi:chemotaxis protein MotB